MGSREEKGHRGDWEEENKEGDCVRDMLYERNINKNKMKHKTNKNS